MYVLSCVRHTFKRYNNLYVINVIACISMLFIQHLRKNIRNKLYSLVYSHTKVYIIHSGDTIKYEVEHFFGAYFLCFNAFVQKVPKIVTISEGRK